MELKVNETPVRTSRNFNINNVRLEDVSIPRNLKEFSNAHIQGNGIGVKSEITDGVECERLVYGNGEVLEKNVYEEANSKLKIKTSKEDLKIVYEFDDDNLELVNNIEIDGIADANIIIEYKSSTNKKCFKNGIVKAIARENCNLNIVIVNILNDGSDFFEAIENELYENSKIKYTIIDLGAKTSITNYYANIKGKNAINDLKTIYLGKDDEVKDLNYIAELRGEKTKVDIDAQGALDGNCKKSFKGTIDFKKGCKKAKGNENEMCLLLSDKAKSIALPMLLCTEDDVEGNHSTASGKVDAKSLFYIMSRGLGYKEAIKLIVKSNFNKIIERIKDEEVKNVVIDEIDRRLD